MPSVFLKMNNLNPEIMKATFSNTIDILVKAYLNDTLEHGSCSACAVGNLVAAACHIHFDGKVTYSLTGKKSWNSFYDVPRWQRVFMTSDGHQGTCEAQYKHEAKRQIDATGYSWRDLARIEKAFESVPERGDRMFNGLMAVVDVLAEIHGISLEAKEETKKMFVKA